MVRPEAAGLRPVTRAPQLSAASCDPLREISILDEHGAHRKIQVPSERALTLIIDDRELVTLMTLGAKPELLVLGFLLNQRIVGDVTAIASISVDWRSGTAAVKSRAGKHDRNVAGVSGTPSTRRGLGTALRGLAAQIDAIKLPPAAAARISQDTLLRVLDAMRHHDAIHRAAGSVHGCALFQGADLWASVEDVSRHNGLDTIAGWMALHGVEGGDKILFTTGRLTGEMVMKAAYNGVPIVVSRNGVTAMGYDVAAKLGMTLFVRASNRRFICCMGAERFDAAVGAQNR